MTAYGKYKYELFQGDCMEHLVKMPSVKMAFCDPPDNIDLAYGEYKDKMPDHEYVALLGRWVNAFIRKADIVWLSFNAKWTVEVGGIVNDLIQCSRYQDIKYECKPCVQVFTFGQHNKNDFGNNHRPLWRINRVGAQFYPEAVKVPSWRQRNGDKRAAPGGRVPGDVLDFQYPPSDFEFDMLMGDMVDQPWVSDITEEAWSELVNYLREHRDILPGDVFDFPRVTGNSKQRCDWHPTQLHEELVKRCVLFSTTRDERVIDPFGGTGTTMRVCRDLDQPCTLFELGLEFSDKIASTLGIPLTSMDAKCRGRSWGGNSLKNVKST